MYSNQPNRFCVISGTAGNGPIEDGFARNWYTAQEEAQAHAVEILKARAIKTAERVARGSLPRIASTKLYVVMTVAVVEVEMPKPAEPPVTVRAPKPDDYPSADTPPMKRGRVHPSDCDDEE